VAPVRIRLATTDDVGVVRELYRRSSMSNEGDWDLFARHPDLLDWPGHGIDEGRTRVAVIDDLVVGFATLSFDASTPEVEDLFVDPDWMRRGIGRALVEDLIATVRAMGRTALEVDANPHALSFYRRVGFIELGAVAVEYGTGMRMRRSTVETLD
jgi:GNAT superfamily N-acetyltransferase